MRFNLRSQKIQLSENDVEKQCLDLVGLKGYFPIRLHAGKYKTLDGKRYIEGVKPGTPDWALIKAPSFLMEVKRPGGELSDVQVQKIRELEICYRLPIVVVESVDQLSHWLDGLGVMKPP